MEVGTYNQADWTDLQNDANHRRKPAIQKESKAIETKENNKEKEDATLSHHLKRIIRQILLETGSIVIEWNYRVTIRYCIPRISMSFTRGRNASPMDHNCHIVRIQQSFMPNAESSRLWLHAHDSTCLFLWFGDMEQIQSNRNGISDCHIIWTHVAS